MKLADANLLLYAVDQESPRYARAKAWLVEQLSGTETIAFAWVTLLAFIRLGTNARIFRRPLGAERAFDIVDGWIGRPNTTILEPTTRHSAVLRELLMPIGTAGNLTTDAHLAALAIEHEAELCSSDADFSRFPGLRWTDPLREER